MADPIVLLRLPGHGGDIKGEGNRGEKAFLKIYKLFFELRRAHSREDEQRREDRDEQQTAAPQGPIVLPPPPPVDYGVFMQGLLQTMQTQAHTLAALQAQLEAQAPTLVPQEHGHGGPSIMERFKRMAPPSFKGESQPLLAKSWMREIEKTFRAIRCAEEDKVRVDV
ncbi:hypothetical protein Taro_010509 [Colocasia esculenta]|uniref:Uncharacterized protein n=1 Tax=Colocasia esculenta TaxID=4460 RepID=A0A843U7S5_COLES|nr:hypothetical protein [Colocasia esculenta]